MLWFQYAGLVPEPGSARCQQPTPGTPLSPVRTTRLLPARRSQGPEDQALHRPAAAGSPLTGPHTASRGQRGTHLPRSHSHLPSLPGGVPGASARVCAVKNDVFTRKCTLLTFHLLPFSQRLPIMTQELGGQNVRGESGSQRWGGLNRDQGSGHMGLAPGKQGREMHHGPESRGSGP